VLKAATLWAMARIVKHGHLSARSLAAALCGGGEFAFVLLALAARERVLPAQVADLVVLAVTLSMLAAPLIMLLQARFDTGGAPAAKPFDEMHHDEPRVIIAGYGRVGQVISRVLRARGIRFTALELSQAQVDFVRRFGNKLYYGDASRLELLRAAGAAEAQVLVVAMDDPEAAVRTAQMARRHFPGLKVVARVRNRQQAFRLFDLGVTEVHRETLGSSLEMAEDVLVHLGVAVGEARHSVKLFRDHDAALLREQHAMKDDEEKLVATARAAAAQLERIFEADPAVSTPAHNPAKVEGDGKPSP
jgi:voltage-gated potassium channel Kch